MQTRIPRIAAASAFTLTLGISLTACSADSTSSNTVNEDAELRVTASTQVWADFADTVVEDTDQVDITAIISGNNTDPHSYEPTARDMALVEQSDIVVLGGGHYDAWLASAAAETDTLVISAFDVDEADHEDHDHSHEDEHAHDHDHAHDGEVNEHVWYDTEALETVGSELTDAVNERLGDGSASMSTLESDLEEIREKKATLDAGTVVQAHPVADYILEGTALEEITPEGYRSATLAEAEPSAADVNAMLEIIESGDADYFIYAPQTSDQVSARLLDAATANGLRVIDVFESPSEEQSFIDLYLSTLDQFAVNPDAGNSTGSDSTESPVDDESEGDSDLLNTPEPTATDE